jgi:hypothetical protein
MRKQTMLAEQRMDVTSRTEKLGATPEARFEAESGGLGHDRPKPFAAACLCDGWLRKTAWKIAVPILTLWKRDADHRWTKVAIA